MKKQAAGEASPKVSSFFDSDRNTIALILVHGIASGRNGATIGTPDSVADAAFRFADALLARAGVRPTVLRTRNGAMEESHRAPNLLS